ncbi:MAG: response regulator [Luteibaculum sp.]
MAENRKPKIHLIDDDDIVNMINEDIIKESRLFSKVYVSDNAEDGLRLLVEKSEEELPDLILLDLNMPEMSGWEFIEELLIIDKNYPHIKQVKLAILSTSNHKGDIIRAAQFDRVKKYFVKPLTQEKLEECIRIIEE